MAALDFDLDASRAYWTTVAQVAGVFAIPLVLEARRTVARWPKTAKVVRRAQSLFYLLAAFVIFETVVVALGRIYSPVADPAGYLLSLLGIVFLAFGLVFIPVLQYFVSVNADWATIVLRGLPWSEWRAARRRYREAEREFASGIADVLANYSEIESVIFEAKKTLKRAVAQTARLAKLKELAELHLDANRDSDEAAEIEETLIVLKELTTSPTSEDNARKVLKSAKKARARVADSLIRGASIADRFDEGRRSEAITYLSPKFIARLEARVGELSADARDEIFVTTGLQEFGAAAKNAQEETDRTLEQVSKFRE